MASPTLRFTVRTPHDVVCEADVIAVRVLTETGQVGIRPRMEPLTLPIEAGLLLVRTAAGPLFIGSAGGLLTSDGAHATLFTPLGVTGNDAAAIRTALDQALAEPGSELGIRAKLSKLEGRILAELHAESSDRPSAAGARR